VQLAVARHTTLTAQRRAAVRAAKQVEGAARLALLHAGWSGCCRGLCTVEGGPVCTA
jgi:hypothetical protein